MNFLPADYSTLEVIMSDNDELERFIDESVKRSIAKGYNPTAFVGMRQRHGTKEAIKRLVIGGDIQSGFRRIKQLGILDWSIEAAVLKFPNEFDKGLREAAEFRLERARGRGG